MRKRKIVNKEIAPDEIFLDSSNLPGLNTGRLEGQMERPLSRGIMRFFAVGAFCVLLILSIQSGNLQLVQGGTLRQRSTNNSLRYIPIFAERGLIYDRNRVPLAWNEDDGRAYIDASGFSHVLGYTGLPREEELVDHFSQQHLGRSGLERTYDEALAGKPGIKIIETNAIGDIASEGVVELPTSGGTIRLTLDARLQQKLFEIMQQTALDRGFEGGAGVIMDVHTGEIISLVSYPEYRSQTLSRGDDAKQIATWNADPAKPFLHRAIAGVYTPGSIIKPFVALTALYFSIISPDTEIYSSGYIDIPNPYDDTDYTRFNDWKAHGYVDMRRALAVSSNVYFYEIGGGYKDQKGIGITRMHDTLSLFGFGKKTDVPLLGEQEGVVPSPAWKAQVFDGEDWLVGDTYYTAIGQFGFGVTAIQMARATAALATNGAVIVPRLLSQIEDVRETQLLGGFLDSRGKDLSDGSVKKIADLPFNTKDFLVVQEGMRLAVLEGSAAGLSIPDIPIAAKTGTAELGVSKQKVNSWVIGYWPYQEPQYAFAVVMEKGSRKNVIGGVSVMRTLFDWMRTNTPEYVK
ncbi:MAG: penicillin-binding transpeptidase domain-containing protein [bacterium]|nr:penicillin-binding transpeptidase domain-containing protein [bacterium]